MAYNLKTLGRFSIDEVLDLHAEWAMGATGKTANIQADNTSYEVNRTSQRYSVFTQSIICYACGLIGEYFLLQQSPGVLACKAHFNLYAELLGEEILFTKDHIVPKSKGGRDEISNYKTMCIRCNMAKADNQSLITPSEILIARRKSEVSKIEKMSPDDSIINLKINQLAWLDEKINAHENK